MTKEITQDERITLIQNEKILEYDKWKMAIPFIKFPADWEVQIQPPYMCVMIRFVVRKGDKTVSVFLDCHGVHGTAGEPFWEMYSNRNGTETCLLRNTNELIGKIERHLSEPCLGS